MNVLERYRPLSSRFMTPAEMCILFSADILAFTLIWFTGFAERDGTTDKRPCKGGAEAAGYPEVRDRLAGSELQHELIWNVAAFVGLKK